MATARPLTFIAGKGGRVKERPAGDWQHVALAAAERGHAVLTSDDADIANVNRDLILVHV